jgi:Xaa-Pro aminopeptidase
LDTSSVNAAIVNAYKAACDKYYQNYENKHKTGNKVFDGSNEKSDVGVPFAVHKLSPVSLAKAIKNETELKGMQDCHLR